VVDDNPLANIDLFKDTKHVIHVVKDGVVFRSNLSIANGKT